MALSPLSEVTQFPVSRSPLDVARRKPRVAIIHYWLIGMRGGEKVIEALCEMFPDADIFTHLYDPSRISDTIKRHKITTTTFQKIPFARKLYRKLVALMPSALEQLDLREYDLVISSESGPAKGVIVRPGALHICYVHTPMRYIWDQYTDYYERSGSLTRFFMPPMTHALRQWDVTSAARVDHFVANSNAVKNRIERYWRRDAEVIPPPVSTQRFRPSSDRGDFYLFVSELVSYKRADLAIRACALLDRKLVVIGDGPQAAELRKMAGEHTEFLGRVPDKVLEDYVSKCRALLFPAEEDFGIVPVEAMAAGAPVIAYNRGGARDYVLADSTGIFMNDQSVPGMIEAIIRFELQAHKFDAKTIAEHARRFDQTIFQERFRETVLDQLDKRPNLAWLRTELNRQWQEQSEPDGDDRRPGKTG
ncbi:MAG: glycosyltransferase [Hyphomonas sp.]|nr:glycosyltransferase [Hyphomonas sp.]HPE47609.1 glycosyltransferase [Hyphomonas sp.]